MKITQKGPEPINIPRPAHGAEARPAAPAKAPSGNEDQVQLSPLASGQLSASEAPFDAENVERIKQAIRNGEFTVNAEVVADRLLDVERGLIRS